MYVLWQVCCPFRSLSLHFCCCECFVVKSWGFLNRGDVSWAEQVASVDVSLSGAKKRERQLWGDGPAIGIVRVSWSHWHRWHWGMGENVRKFCWDWICLYILYSSTNVGNFHAISRLIVLLGSSGLNLQVASPSTMKKRTLDTERQEPTAKIFWVVVSNYICLFLPLPRWKLTWHWKIPTIWRCISYWKLSDFSASHVSFRGCTWGNDSVWRACSSDGLVQPPTSLWRSTRIFRVFIRPCTDRWHCSVPRLWNVMNVN